MMTQENKPAEYEKICFLVQLLPCWTKKLARVIELYVKQRDNVKIGHTCKG